MGIPRQMEISVKITNFSNPYVFYAPLMGFLLELGISARDQKN